MDPLPQRPETNDYYRVLGLKYNADDIEIERAFRKRSAATHPDSTNRVPDYCTFNEVRQSLALPFTHRVVVFALVAVLILFDANR